MISRTAILVTAVPQRINEMLGASYSFLYHFLF